MLTTLTSSTRSDWGTRYPYSILGWLPSPLSSIKEWEFESSLSESSICCLVLLFLSPSFSYYRSTNKIFVCSDTCSSWHFFLVKKVMEKFLCEKLVCKIFVQKIFVLLGRVRKFLSFRLLTYVWKVNLEELWRPCCIWGYSVIVPYGKKPLEKNWHVKRSPSAHEIVML